MLILLQVLKLGLHFCDFGPEEDDLISFGAHLEINFIEVYYFY